MKNISKVLSIVILGTSSIIPTIPIINNLEESYNHKYTVSLDHDQIKQDKDEYNLVANIQGIIKFFNKKAPLQRNLEVEFNSLNSKKSYLEAVTELLNNYIENSYSNFTIPKDFGQDESDRTFFQAAVAHSLLKKEPILLYGTGSLPWWSNQKPKNFFVSIYQTGTPIDDDPDEAYYSIVDTMSEQNKENNLNADELVLLFKRAGVLWMPSKKFDFLNKQITLNPSLKGSFYNGIVDRNQSAIFVNQKVNLWEEAGIFSFDFIRNFVTEFHLIKSFIFYRWEDYLLTNTEQIWGVNEYWDKEEVEWDNDDRTSVVLDSMLSDIYITIFSFSKYRYEFQTLQLMNKIEIGSNKPDEVEQPYIGISMGQNWVINWI